jgi:hypothetical protein
MTAKPIKDEKLLRLADALFEDLMSTPDAELLSELEKFGPSPSDVEAQAAADLDEALARIGREKLAVAQAGVATQPRRTRKPRSDNVARARRRLAQAFSPKDATKGRMTLAARLGQDMPDEDIEGLIEDAADLGIDIDETEDSPDSG